MTKDDVYELVKRQARAWEQADLDAIVADFAADCLFISPGGRWQGPAAIRQAAIMFFETVAEVKIDVKRVLLDGDEGAVEWDWREVRRADGRTYRAEDSIIFSLRDGKIVYWREYFDTAQMTDPV